MGALVVMPESIPTGARPQREAVLAPLPATAAEQVRAAARYDLRILRSLRRIVRSIDLYSKHLASTNQVTTPQLVCLLAVVDHGPLTATAISREVHLSPSTVVGILDRLEEKGLIARARAQDDRRVVQVTATPRGAELTRKAPSPLQQTLANALNALPELEQATIALSLERIVTLMEAQEIDAAPILTADPLNPTTI